MYYPGTILLWMAFLLGLASTASYALAHRREAPWRVVARQTYVLMAVAVVVAAALFMYLLLGHDYRLAYVWGFSDNSLPIGYLISTFWAGQEGSFLLWIVWGAVLGLPLMRFARHYETTVMPVYNLTVLALVLLLLRQSPFRFHQGLTPDRIPLDGQGLNPLLQNPWMVIHPPIMFLGYASLAVPFAFAVAGLIRRRYDEWVKVSLPWVLLSLVSLGAAIMLGGYWAYETLGWGGYWGWDPVENASLVPWLITAGLAHGMLLQRGRGRFRRLNLVLAVLAYLFVVYATFLTRSGVLADFSVHSFVDLGITGWLVFIMMFFLTGSVAVLAWRWREIPTETGDEPFLSRTVFFVLGIVLLVLTGFMVAVGTSAPIITRLWTEPSSVGPDFYNRVGFPLAIAFAVFLGAIPFLGWRGTVSGAVRRLAAVAAVSVALTGLAVALGVRRPASVVYVLAAVFVVVANGWVVAERARRGALRTAGGYLAHVGLGLMLLAFLTTGLYDRSEKVSLEQDVPVKVLGYTLTFRGVEKPTPEARDAMVVEVTSPRGRNFVLKPKMWVNRKSNQLVANPDIKSFLTKDIYLAPVEFRPAEEPEVTATLELGKGQTATFRDWKLTFEGFDLSSQHAVPGAFTVGVRVRLERPGEEPVTLEPSVVSSDEGTTAIAAAIPGTHGAKLRVSGMNASAGMVRLELLGLGGGVARTAVLGKGESFAYGGMKVTFRGFDLSDFDPQAGRIHIGATFTVERGGRTAEVEAYFRGGRGGEGAIPVEIPASGGMRLELGRIDAEAGRVEVRLYDPNLAPRPPRPATLVLDVSTKPLIGLVWLGTLLVIAGIVMAIALRRRDVAALAGREG